MIEVATLSEMCQILKIDNTTGAKHWRKWPHFFATDGRDARSVRFIPEKVIEALAMSNGRLDVQDKGRTAVQGDSVSRRRGRGVQARVSDKIGGSKVAPGHGGTIPTASGTDPDRYGIFSRCKSIPQ